MSDTDKELSKALDAYKKTAEERMLRSKEENARETFKPSMANPGMKKGGKVSSASSRADGIASKGKTRGRMV